MPEVPLAPPVVLLFLEDVEPVPAEPLEPVLLVAPLAPPVLPTPEVRLVDWQPAARTAASVKPSRAAGRKLDVKAMKIPR
jgi:hypothetical protein